MRVLFIVQGEGRGHLTQALAVQSMLERAGHELVRVLVGRTRHRDLPTFFANNIPAPVDLVDSPGFSIGQNQRSVRSLNTLTGNIARIPVFGHSLRVIGKTIETLHPDVVLTFYEPLAGVYQAFHRTSIPFIAIGHQYMFGHPAYDFPQGHTMDRSAIRLFTRLTSLGATWKLALSLYEAPDLPHDRLSVIPPLLRETVRALQPHDIAQEDFFLVYLLNRGYAKQVMAWHAHHPERRLECFWDNPEADDITQVDDTLRFHRLHDTRFLALMARCAGLVCTAGFESVAEAVFLGKPILSIPVEGHYEQRCNAHEVERLGIGVRGETFDMDLLENFLLRHSPSMDTFRRWVSQAEHRVLHVLESVMTGRRPETHPHPPDPEALSAASLRDRTRRAPYPGTEPAQYAWE